MHVCIYCKVDEITNDDDDDLITNDDKITKENKWQNDKPHFCNDYSIIGNDDN